MYQITDGTFREAKRYCIHDHVVIQDGPWHDMKSCWFNSLYSRVVPSHAIELTAALLDRNVASALTHQRLAPATFKQKQDLAAVIHLCGAAAGNAYAAHGFRLTRNQRCGDHDVSNYLVRVNGMKHHIRPAGLRRLAVPAHQIFSAESGVAMDSSDRPSALTPNHSSTSAPVSIIPAPTR